MSLNPWTIRDRLFESDESREQLFVDIERELFGVPKLTVVPPSFAQDDPDIEAQRKRMAEMEEAVKREEARERAEGNK